MKQTHRKGISRRGRDLTTLIVARGDEVRYVTFRPWQAMLAGSAVAVFAVALLSAAAYLALHDDLIGATADREAQLQEAYEVRIATLRAQVDRVTRQQVLEQQHMQRKMAELIERQERLTQQQSHLRPVLERAGELRANNDIPLPSPRPDRRADLKPDELEVIPSAVAANAYTASVRSTQAPWPLRSSRIAADAKQPDHLLVALDRSLQEIESDQLERIEALAEKTYQTSELISEALDAAGVTAVASNGDDAAGGPLLAAVENLSFEEQVRELDEALDRLDKLKRTARRFPVDSPLDNATVTSRFGTRRDPIIGRIAHHSGVDFRAKPGTPVRSAGSGTVVRAGWNGGYGRMVEIDHGDGISTRYAHMSKILVKEGARVDSGEVLGQVGSSGRSTGPHLHYEVRRNGEAVNPLAFISAGRLILRYL